VKKYFLVILSIVLLSCRNDETNNSSEANQYNITEYKADYMNYRNLNYGIDSYTLFSGENVKLEYSNGRISKRITNLFVTRNDQPQPIYYNTTDEITYDNNKINIIFKSDNESFFPTYQKQITLDGDRISQILVNKSNTKDTLKFTYNNNVLNFVTVYNKGIKSKSTFYFNANKNVDSIVTKYGNINYVSDTNYSYSFNETAKKRKKVILSNYDNYKNPLKNLIIFDETFFRSLSENNYKFYGEYFYDENNFMTSYFEGYWNNFIYENNQINFAK